MFLVFSKGIMAVQSDISLQKAYDFLKKGDPEHARSILTGVLSSDLENQEIMYALKCAAFWTDKLVKVEGNAAFLCQHADTILDHWRQFYSFMGRLGVYDHCVYAMRVGVFSLVLECYQSALSEKEGVQSAEVYRKVGLCYKKLGDYDTALRFLETANSLSSESPAVLSEMADCYALCGEEKTAKVIFREAFFIDAQKIDLSLLDSQIICSLVDQVSTVKKCSENELLEWIPVYGILYGVFTVKRELRALEIGKLMQSVYALENSLKEVGSDCSILIPRLINRYFWLIDHYIIDNDQRSRINEVLLKIKILDSAIYEKYTN
ncbi:MAG: tetratricopeptide repeat protein [Treponemataceae bacterium]